MVIYMVVFRLEIADECEYPTIFQPYCAPHYSIVKQTNSDPKTYATVVSHPSPDKSSDLIVNEIVDDIEEHRGLRQLKDITLESFNFDEMEMSKEGLRLEDKASFGEHVSVPSTSSGDANVAGDRSDSTRPKSHSPSSHLPTAIHFFSGNPSVELTKGIMHIYKDSERKSLDEGVNRSEMICILGVPASQTLHDLIMFTAPMTCSSSIEYMRIIRCSLPNQYMVLLKFRSQKSADEFYKHSNNRPFNTLEPDICHLVYVAKMEITKESEGATFPVPGLLELPTCPVCLEKMDESVDGVLTVLCNHSFHTSCLAKWGDTSCPVCRYSQTPEDVADNHCMKCGSNESLWICLICGHVGCGRYVGLHAYRHFQDTNHTYAMQLGNNRVWDYAGDNYVHRLVQNKSDGKLVEVDEGGNVVQDEKLDSLSLEYTYLLTTQLESQRQYFEEKMEETITEAEQRVQETKDRWKTACSERDTLERRLVEATKDRQSLDKKCSQFHDRLSKSLSELQEETEMNKCLRENQQIWQTKVNSLETKLKDGFDSKDMEIKDLQEQLRDLMFFLDAQHKLSSTSEISQEEIQEGKVIIGGAASPSSSGKKLRKKPR